MADTSVFRLNGISYLEIPSLDVKLSAAFYHIVFGWKLHGESTSNPSFEDGTGHVIGHWKTHLVVTKDAGIIPYVYVEDVDSTLEKVRNNGGEILKAPYLEGDLRVATFRDPAGNTLGIWQRVTS